MGSRKRKTGELTADDLAILAAAIIGDTEDEEEMLQAFHDELEQLLELPCDAHVIGEPVQLTAIVFEGQVRRGVTATCLHKGREFVVSLLDVYLPPDAVARPYLDAYRSWAGAAIGTAEGEAIEPPPPSRPVVDPRTKHWPIYELKITLRGIRPPIWRRVQVSGNENLAKLHRIIQIAMGWEDSHLHQFIVDGERVYADRSFELEDAADERKINLRTIAPQEGSSFVYEYDLGDSWEHDIVVEKILSPDSVAWTPICVAAKRACPPEDCGGPYGYITMLEALADPEHDRHEELSDWCGSFDPSRFDRRSVNAVLRALK